MKTLRITATAFAALAVFVPVAQAGSSDASVDASTTTTTTATTATTPATTATTPTTTTDTATPTTTTETPGTTTDTTTDTGVPVTVPDTATTTTDTATTTTDTDELGLDDLVSDIPADVAAADCIDATCAAAAVGAGGVPIVGAGASLPFTGISDMVAPVLLALVVLLAGIVAIRWAQLREAVARNGSRRIINGTALVTKTGYAAAMRDQAIDSRARNFYGPRVA